MKNYGFEIEYQQTMFYCITNYVDMLKSHNVNYNISSNTSISYEYQLLYICFIMLTKVKKKVILLFKETEIFNAMPYNHCIVQLSLLTKYI